MCFFIYFLSCFYLNYFKRHWRYWATYRMEWRSEWSTLKRDRKDFSEGGFGRHFVYDRARNPEHFGVTNALVAIRWKTCLMWHQWHGKLRHCCKAALRDHFLLPCSVIFGLLIKLQLWFELTTGASSEPPLLLLKRKP